MSTTIEKLNKIKTLLGVDVKMESLKLENGTELQADKFEAGQSVFILTEDEKVPLPAGNYELEDNKVLVVENDGIILSISEAKLDEHEEEEVEEEIVEEEEVEAAYVTKEEMEKEMSKLKEELAEMISELVNHEEEMSAQTEEIAELKEELSKPAANAIKHKPVSENKPINLSNNNGHKYATSILDRVVGRINNIKQ